MTTYNMCQNELRLVLTSETAKHTLDDTVNKIQE